MANNPKFVGCFDDVKHIMDRQCSGLPECDVRITDQTFDGIQPCYAGLKMHLEASFLCIHGIYKYEENNNLRVLNMLFSN